MFDYFLNLNKKKDPSWFNTVFKEIFNVGKKTLTEILQSVTENISTVKTKVDKELKVINPRNKSFFTSFDTSSSKKISFYNLFETLFKVQEILQEENNFEKIILPLKRSFGLNENRDFSQVVYFVNQYRFDSFISEIFKAAKMKNVTREMKEYTKNVLIDLGIVCPRDKSCFERGNIKNYYIFPFLFPTNKPKSIYAFSKDAYKHNWTVTYDLDFKPSSTWRMIFLRVRNAVENIEIIDEVYWKDGKKNKK